MDEVYYSKQMTPPDWIKKHLRPRLLLHPPIPKSLWGVNPRNIEEPKVWNGMRYNAVRKFGYHCWACGTFPKEEGKQLEAHEVYDFDFKLRKMTFTEVVALCELCHGYIHSWRLKALVEKGEMKVEDFERVMAHGTGVLKAAGESMYCPANDLDSGIWVLVYSGKEHRGK